MLIRVGSYIRNDFLKSMLKKHERKFELSMQTWEMAPLTVISKGRLESLDRTPCEQRRYIHLLYTHTDSLGNRPSLSTNLLELLNKE